MANTYNKNPKNNNVEQKQDCEYYITRKSLAGKFTPNRESE